MTIIAISTKANTPATPVGDLLTMMRTMATAIRVDMVAVNTADADLAKASANSDHLALVVMASKAGTVSSGAVASPAAAMSVTMAAPKEDGAIQRKAKEAGRGDEA
ncbi:hypothetical protein G5V57_04590 [Nordella sp. HKS 07]|uniref:hypothetical protein n=1 Tax=Nordella sp. HKS 07 TaxID=2712222 RepID=UPI0013E1FB63|nr:hypothetical protein [Nordella sp. HKS 07]QIG47085.1 hypothetical protein G5V57_04590 [Nordella sp. HKS 07]